MNSLKLFFIKLICPEFFRYKERNDNLQKILRNREDEFREIASKYSSVEKLLDLFNNIKREKKDDVIRFVQSKNGEFHILSIVHWSILNPGSNLVDIKVYGSNNGLHSPACLMQIKKHPESSKIGILDIKGISVNIGLGSIAMNTLIQYAKKNEIQKIVGYISPVDWDHIDRLKHFYSKSGFEIILDKPNKKGKIIQNL